MRLSILLPLAVAGNLALLCSVVLGVDQVMDTTPPGLGSGKMSAKSSSYSYIIELDPDAAKASAPSLQNVDDHLACHIKGGYRTGTRWDHPETFVGLVVEFNNPHDHKVLQSIPGLRGIYPNLKFQVPAFSGTVVPIDFVKHATGKDLTRGVDDKPLHRRDEPASGEAVPPGYTDTFDAHVLGGVDKAHARGFFGKGQKIAILDTGVDYTHPALGGCFGKGCKIIGGYDLVGDAYNGSNTPQPEADPRPQCNEGFEWPHGTLVAGIIAAEDKVAGFTGVAPHANLMMYRTSGCNGLATTETIISALQRAYQEGSDVILISAGAPQGWDSSPEAVVAARINSLGVPVVVDAGNSGLDGLYFADTPAAAAGVTSVGSVNNDVLTGHKTDLLNGTTVVKTITYLAETPLKPDPKGASVVDIFPLNKSEDSPGDACSALPANTPDLSKVIVLVEGGSCDSITKFENLFAKGGKKVLIYRFSDAHDVAFPQSNHEDQQTAALLPEDGKWIKEQINAGKKISIDLSKVPSFSKIPSPIYPGLMSGYSTYGPSNDNRFYPSLSAPGANIISTNPVSEGSYAIVAGTSYSGPYIAGAYALYRSAHGGKTDAATLRNVFASTSKPLTAKDSKLLQTAAQQGAGLINVFRALNQQVLVFPALIELNDTAHFKGSQVITLTNKGKTAVSFKITHLPAGTVHGINETSSEWYDFPLPLSSSYASVEFSSTDVTVPPGRSVKFTATFKPPSGVKPEKIPVYSGYLHLESQGDQGASSLNVAYMCTATDLGQISPIWRYTDETGLQVPLITEGSGIPLLSDGGTVFSMANVTNWPIVNVKFTFATRYFQLDLVKPDIDPKLVHASLPAPIDPKALASTPSRSEDTPASGAGKGDAPPAPAGKEHASEVAAGKTDTASSASSADGTAKHKRLVQRRGTPAAASSSAAKTEVEPGPKFDDVPIIGTWMTGELLDRNGGQNSGNPGAGYGLSSQFLPMHGKPATNIGPGSYRVLLRVQKPFTDGKLMQDYDTWLSYSFEIK